MPPSNSQKRKIYLQFGYRNLREIDSCSYRLVVEVGFEGFALHKDTLRTEKSRSGNLEIGQYQMQVDYVFEEKQIIGATILQTCGNEERIFAQCNASIGRLIHLGGYAEIPMEITDERSNEQAALNGRAVLLLNMREDTQKKENFQLKISGTDLDKKDLFGKSDPYLIIYKRNDKGKLVRTYRTEVIKSNLSPDWKPIAICLNRLCDDNYNNEVIVRCFDWDGADGDPEDMDSDFDEIIGECSFTCQQLLDSPNNVIYLELINYKKQKKKRGYLHSGKLQLHADLSQQTFTFLDYMLSGIDLNFIVAVDLSCPKVNLEDQIESIRLYNVSRQTSEYEVAIKAVLEILQEYDSDNQFPAFGFGAQIPPDYRECHEYPLNGDFQNPFCRGYQGVLSAYQNALQTVKPTTTASFSPVIKQVNNLSRSHCDGRNYFTLLLLTNGAAQDWTETKKAVIEASMLPVSIIVVGIGSGEFVDMKVLDQDKNLLRVGADKAHRDNVQFVPMRKFLRKAADGSRSIKWNKTALAKEVLAELPDQVVEYMNHNNIKPPAPTPSSIGKASSTRSTFHAPSSSSATGGGGGPIQKPLRRCVTAHVNIRPSSASGEPRRKFGQQNQSNTTLNNQENQQDSGNFRNASPQHQHANFFANNCGYNSSRRKSSIDAPYKPRRK